MTGMNFDIDINDIPSNLSARVKDAVDRALKDPQSRGSYDYAVTLVAAATVRKARRSGWSVEDAHKLGAMVSFIAVEDESDRMADRIAEDLQAILTSAVIDVTPMEKALIASLAICDGRLALTRIIPEVPGGAGLVLELTRKGLIDGSVHEIHLTDSGWRVAKILDDRENA